MGAQNMLRIVVKFSLHIRESEVNPSFKIQVDLENNGKQQKLTI